MKGTAKEWTDKAEADYTTAARELGQVIRASHLKI